MSELRIRIFFTSIIRRKLLQETRNVQKMPENRHFVTDVKIMPPESHLLINLIAEIMTLIAVIIQHRVESLMKEEEGMKTVSPMEKVTPVRTEEHTEAELPISKIADHMVKGKRTVKESRMVKEKHTAREIHIARKSHMETEAIIMIINLMDQKGHFLSVLLSYSGYTPSYT